MEKTIHTPEYNALLALLKEARGNAGITQVEMAEKLSLTQSMFSKMERGELRIDVVQLRAICRVLGLSLTELVRAWEEELAKEG